MAEFQWWLLLVGLVAGGGLVAVVSMDGRRREEDLADLERRAEASWIAARLNARDPNLDARSVAAILRIHREYLSLPPPDRLAEDGETWEGEVTVGDEVSGGPTDQDPDEIGDTRGGGTDDHLAGT